MLPAVLKHFNLFTDAVNWQGQTEEITLPKLSRLLERYRAGGMSGPVALDMGQQAIDMEVTLGGFLLSAVKKYAAPKHDAVMMRFAGAYQDDTDGAITAVEVIVRGRYEEIDFGNAKAGEKSQKKIKLACSYYKLTVNNQATIELDFVNMIEIVDGVDLLAKHKAAIGL